MYDENHSALMLELFELFRFFGKRVPAAGIGLVERRKPLAPNKKNPNRVGQDWDLEAVKFPIIKLTLRHHTNRIYTVL